MENVHHKNIRNKSKWLQMIVTLIITVAIYENKREGKMLRKWRIYFTSLFLTVMFLTGYQERNTENKEEGYTEKVQVEMKVQREKLRD